MNSSRFLPFSSPYFPAIFSDSSLFPCPSLPSVSLQFSPPYFPFIPPPPPLHRTCLHFAFVTIHRHLKCSNTSAWTMANALTSSSSLQNIHSTRPTPHSIRSVAQCTACFQHTYLCAAAPCDDGVQVREGNPVDVHATIVFVCHRPCP
jgi:hypothetical protein